MGHLNFGPLSQTWNPSQCWIHSCSSEVTFFNDGCLANENGMVPTEQVTSSHWHLLFSFFVSEMNFLSHLGGASQKSLYIMRSPGCMKASHLIQRFPFRERQRLLRDTILCHYAGLEETQNSLPSSSLLPSPSVHPRLWSWWCEHHKQPLAFRWLLGAPSIYRGVMSSGPFLRSLPGPRRYTLGQ